MGRPEVQLDQLADIGPPERLGHYTDAGGALGILRNGAIWASHIRFLNDAREFAHAVEIARRYVQDLERMASGPFPLRTSLLAQLEAMPGNTFVASFSVGAERLSQWRGYCPAGGYKLVFNGPMLKARANASHFYFVKCIYDRSEQERLVRDLIDTGLSYFPSWPLPPPPYPTDPNEEMKADWFSAQWFFPRMNRLASAMKDPAFAEEQEWRAVGGIWSSDEVPLVRARGALLLPYLTLNLRDTGEGLYPCVTEVMVGPGLDQELADFGLAKLFQSIQPGAIQITRSSAPYRFS